MSGTTSRPSYIRALPLQITGASSFEDVTRYTGACMPPMSSMLRLGLHSDVFGDDGCPKEWTSDFVLANLSFFCNHSCTFSADQSEKHFRQLQRDIHQNHMDRSSAHSLSSKNQSLIKCIYEYNSV